MVPAIDVRALTKTYLNGFTALHSVDLTINKGEIFALLGPNGAGKTTLIGIICGLVNPTSGTVLVEGADAVADFRTARSRIGLVPQELTANAFESVWDTVSFSRGLFGKAPDPAYIEKILKDLSLWDKRKNRMMTLSGGMKRRVLIAKALSHEPSILFLDEPTAGVDVSLRKGMWRQVEEFRQRGGTIILTTHYLEEAEEMADRIGVINQGKIVVVEEKEALMRRLGSKRLVVELASPLKELPESLRARGVCQADGRLVYQYNPECQEEGIESLLAIMREEGISFRDLHTTQRSLEDIFVELVEQA